MSRVAKMLVTLPLTLFWYVWYGNWGIWLAIVASVAFHELGHALACIVLRIPFDVRFRVLGACVIKKAGRKLNSKEIFVVSSSGPLFTLILVFFCICNLMFGVKNPAIEFVLAINTFTLGLNLLPIKPLDGGNMLLALRSWVYTKLNHEKLVVTDLYVPAAYFFSYSLYLLLFVLGNRLLGNILTLTPQAMQHGLEILMQYDLTVRLGWLSPF